MMTDWYGKLRGPWTLLRITGLIVFGALTAAIIALLFGWVVQLLWNWLMPAIFGLGKITYWQGFGLVLLGRLLFGSVGGHNGRKDSYDRIPWHRKEKEDERRLEPLKEGEPE